MLCRPLEDDARRRATCLPHPAAAALRNRNARADRKLNTYGSSHLGRDGPRRLGRLPHSESGTSNLTNGLVATVATTATDEPWFARLSQLSQVSQCLPFPTWLIEERHRCRIQMCS